MKEQSARDWSISARFVSWPDLEPIFRVRFPTIIHNAWLNSEIAEVQYVGVTFEIRPFFTQFSKPDEFRVYGPPHVNIFPDHSAQLKD